MVVVGENATVMGVAERVKGLGEMVRNTEFGLIDEKVLVELARIISGLYGMGVESARQSVREQFFSYIIQLLLYNIDTIPIPSSSSSSSS